jgi:hypothetical protein
MRNSSLAWETKSTTRCSRLRRISQVSKPSSRPLQTLTMRFRTASTWRHCSRSTTSNSMIPTVSSLRINQRVRSTRHGGIWKSMLMVWRKRKRELWYFVSTQVMAWSTRTNRCCFATSSMRTRNSTRCSMQRRVWEILQANVKMFGSWLYSLAAVRNMWLQTLNCALASMRRKLLRLEHN